MKRKTKWMDLIVVERVSDEEKKNKLHFRMKIFSRVGTDAKWKELETISPTRM